MVIFLFPCSHDPIYIAPPRPLVSLLVFLIALLPMNLALDTLPFTPAQNIAPPSPVLPYGPTTKALAVLLVKFEFIISPS